MRIGKATALFMNINTDQYSDEDKLCAIKIVADMPTHMSISKNAMVDVIKWQAARIPSPSCAPAKETSIVMKKRHQFRGPDYDKPYCGECGLYVPDENADYCCWCGSKFVIPGPSMLAEEAEE